MTDRKIGNKDRIYFQGGQWILFFFLMYLDANLKNFQCCHIWLKHEKKQKNKLKCPDEKIFTEVNQPDSLVFLMRHPIIKHHMEKYCADIIWGGHYTSSHMYRTNHYYITENIKLMRYRGSSLCLRGSTFKLSKKLELHEWICPWNGSPIDCNKGHHGNQMSFLPFLPMPPDTVNGCSVKSISFIMIPTHWPISFSLKSQK